MKFALCCVAGKENLYIREWVEHHIRVGFDKIVIYTTIPEENPRSVLFDYEIKGIVDIIPWYIQIPEGRLFEEVVQDAAYNDCLERYKESYNWMAFFDVDEFLEVTYGDIHIWFESMPVYSQFDAITVNWYTMNADGKLYYEDKPLYERFTCHNNAKLLYYKPHPNRDDTTRDCYFKSIVNTKTPHRFSVDAHMGNPHKLYGNCVINDKFQLQMCTNDGCSINGPLLYTLPDYNHDHAKLKHFETKSLTEYIDRKLGNNGWGSRYDREFIKRRFAEINEWTPEHDFVLDIYIDTLKNK